MNITPIHVFSRSTALLAALAYGTFVAPTTGYGASIPRAAAASVTTLMPSTLPETTVGDSGAFAEAPPAYWATFTDPVQCLVAVDLAEARAWRTLDARLVQARTQYTLADTLSSVAVTTARGCGQKFTGKESLFAGPHGLVKLKAWFQLALSAGQDSLARIIVDRMEHQGEQEAVLIWVIQTYLEAKPARVTAADAYADSLVSGRADGALASMWGHWRVQRFGTQRFDRAMIRREAEQIYALQEIWSPKFTDVQQAGFGGADKVLDYAFTADLLVTAVDHPDSLLAVTERLRAQIVAGNAHTDDQTDFKTEKTEGLAHYVEDNYGVVATGMPHQPYPSRVDAHDWQPAVGQDTVVPTPRHISLVVFLPSRSPLLLGPTEWPSEAVDLDPFNTELSNMIARYQSCGLTVTIIASPQEPALGGVIETPAQIAKAYAWYYQQSMHLPITAAVDSAQRLPSMSDGRLYNAPGASVLVWGAVDQIAQNGTWTPWQAGNYYWRGGLSVLTDRTGQVLWDSRNKGGGDATLSTRNALLERECSSPRARP